MLYIIIGVIAYLLGTFPSALFLVKWTSGEDIRSKGTGNIGAMNSYDITRRKWVGIAVFLLDALKGIVAVLISRIIQPGDFISASIAAFFVVFGHNFNAFLGFKGGRGLASAVGVFLMINPLIVIIWALAWIMSFYLIRKNVHISNAIATVAAPAIILVLPDTLINFFMLMTAGHIYMYKILGCAIAVIILLRHIAPLRELWVKS